MWYVHPNHYYPLKFSFATFILIKSQLFLNIKLPSVHFCIHLSYWVWWISRWTGLWALYCCPQNSNSVCTFFLPNPLILCKILLCYDVTRLCQIRKIIGSYHLSQNILISGFLYLPEITNNFLLETRKEWRTSLFLSLYCTLALLEILVCYWNMSFTFSTTHLHSSLPPPPIFHMKYSASFFSFSLKAGP